MPPISRQISVSIIFTESSYRIFRIYWFQRNSYPSHPSNIHVPSTFQFGRIITVLVFRRCRRVPVTDVTSGKRCGQPLKYVAEHLRRVAANRIVRQIISSPFFSNTFFNFCVFPTFPPISVIFRFSGFPTTTLLLSLQAHRPLLQHRNVRRLVIASD